MGYFCLMNKKIYVTVTDTERLELERLLRESPSHRIRQRCQALLWSSVGRDRKSIASLYETKPDTISAWYKRWDTDKFSSLSDLPRTGRPSRLDKEQKKT
jgi:transposase